MKAFDKPQAVFRSWVVVEVFRGHSSQKGGCRGEHESWVWKKQQRGCASGPCGTGSQNTQPLLGEAVKRAGVPEEGLDEGGRVCPSGRSYRRRILFSVDSFSVLDTGQDQLSRGSGIRT